MEANAEHDFRLKRLIGMFRTTKRAPFFLQSAKRHCREDLLTPESYKVKKYAPLRIPTPKHGCPGSFSLNVFLSTLSMDYYQ